MPETLIQIHHCGIEKNSTTAVESMATAWSVKISLKTSFSSGTRRCVTGVETYFLLIRVN